MDLNDINVFAAVARHQSFTAAGRALDLAPSAVSRRVARLEEALGFELLHRTTRRVGLTEAGRVFFERTAGIPGQIEAAVMALAETRDRPAGTLRITAPPDDGGIIWSLLGGFMRDHPQVDIELTHTLAKVDLLEERIDVALRGGPPPDTTVYTARLIFDSRIMLAAAPAYLARRGTPTRVEQLAEHDGVCMDPWAPNAIRRLDGDRGPVRVSMRNRLKANSLETARRAAIDGLGIAPLLELTCRRALARGELVEVLRGALPPRAAMWALSPIGRQRSAAATALVEHMARVVADPDGVGSAG